ncbi:quinolinate synthase NadA [Alkalibacter mobilis]|uniref:quinolinate synthase NadA n=1 Tax=Alkalibacter mobilis TaxID=2787712 RepID=UPI0018A051BF|nr:quinolinate synthase NadA [Alkalibacter mobilis]MBF7097486.1 quinolinate synthase NadA [Alkalibacter mobilis]
MIEDLKAKILELKNKRDAIILAHYYQRPEIQEIADIVGDSYFLSEQAKDCRQSTIVFCGVKFMAESAKILSPEKTVLFPVMDAGCPLADTARHEDVEAFVKQYPEAAVVTYINSSTEVKALSDVCVTSSSAEMIISNMPQKDIVFLPDKNLGSYLSEKLPNKNFILWDGACPIHDEVESDKILDLKNEVKGAKVLVHPECNKDVRDLADYVGSTGGIIDFAGKSDSKYFIVVTEVGIEYQLKLKYPSKQFHFLRESMVCHDMKKIELTHVYECLKIMKPEIGIEENTRVAAYESLMNMHRFSR